MSDKSKFRQVLVDVAEYDKDGNPIPLDSLSSGGARNADGSLITQYRNPRLLEPANEPAADPEFDEWLNREHEARLRREEEAEDRRRKENAEIASLVVENLIIPFAKNVVVPRARNLWNAKVLPGGKQLAQRLLRPKDTLPELPHVGEDASQVGAEAKKLAGTDTNGGQVPEIADVQSDAEEVPLVGVIVTEGSWTLDPPKYSVASDFSRIRADLRPPENRKSNF